MSIMDHDPKYAKLRAWRETTYRELRIAEYRQYIERYSCPPPALCRWVAQERERELLPVCTPLMNMVPRKQYPYPTLQWRLTTDPPEPWTEVVTELQIVYADFAKRDQ